MAWEELLRQHDRSETARPDAEADAGQRGGGLIRRAGELIGQTDAEAADDRADEREDDVEIPPCADGYVRKSPVQAYCTAEDYNSRRIRKAILIAVGVCFVVLLGYALVRAGLLRFR